MQRSRYRDRVIFAWILIGAAGISLLVGGIAWVVLRESRTAEQTYADTLARRVGARAEQIILDSHDMLKRLNAGGDARCDTEHLERMQREAAVRPWVRAIGHWRAAERLCGVGLIEGAAPTPHKADRVYPSGVLAWWPSQATAVGGVPMFLMRYGDHDVAIDSRLLVDADPLDQRDAALWVEGLPLASTRSGAALPAPDELAPGLTIDARNDRVLSRHSIDSVLPIEIVAAVPIARVWRRHLGLLVSGAALAVLLLAVWVWVVLRYSRRQLSLEQQFRRGLARGEIRVHYQPVVDLATGRCVGAEALARWHRPDGEPIGPDIFVPAAERAGLAHALTCVVLHTVIDECAALLLRTPSAAITVNLAPDDLADRRLQDYTAKLLRLRGVSPACIHFEITERSLINSDVARAQIRGFRADGHQVAVDDFGTGYSSLSYLQTFELDVLKIDRIFVEAIGTQSATREVIPHVIAMARDLGLEVVAEGVQTTEQVDWLRAHGVRYGQGHMFGRAVDIEAFTRFFDESSGSNARRRASSSSD